ncbi:non-ribosomal peptide synthetase [Herbidospora yilanensis]|uniref:non-ribosomal peptide synthetase n=1 Tax=Herbidospora yilanensis TaxID=354426 RepID=UPI0007812872|nr:non-ribosomal peptide synthetase [Herbidospora yilanensis]
MNRDHIDDLYGLSPLQAGMLLHELRSPDQDVYGVQVTCEITGPLDPVRFRRAWAEVLARHPILRTAFLSDGLEQPVQVVFKDADPPWREVDLRGEADPERRLAELLDADRAERFRLDRAPLTRITVVRLGAADHRLVWSFHHLLLDGWSMPLVLREVLDVYEAERPQATPPPFRDYIAWLGERDTAAAERFWRHELAGLDRPTPLGVDRPATGEAPEFAEHHLALTSEQTAALRRYARDHRLTVNTLTQGAWALLLSRYSGERDVVFGATLALRPAEIPGVETMVGPMINTVPVRARVRDARCADWLAELQTAQNRARPFAHASLVDVAAWSGAAAGSPLFESLLVFENQPRETTRAGRGLAVSGVRVREWTNYPLTIVAHDDGDRLAFKLLHDETRIDGPTAERLGRHLSGMLAAIVADPAAHVTGLDYWPGGERELVLTGWNVTPSAHAGFQTVHELVAEQARTTPSAVAISCAGRTLTYAELERRADQVAGLLAARGVGAEQVVGVCLPRDLELPAVLLGILKAGAAYLPLDPAYPRPRLAFMVEDAAPAVIVTTAELADRLPDHPGVVLSDAFATADDAPPAVAVRPDDLAYLIYTSGSTGRPKGVATTHRGVVRLVKEATFARLTADEVFLHLAPLAFDASTLEIWGALANGARLALFPGTHPSLTEIGAVVADEGVTTLWLSAGLFHRMVEERLGDLRPLRQLLAGGEALSPPHVRRAIEALPGCAVVNGYGPTETTTFTSCHHVTEVTGASVPIGVPIGGTHVYVLDEGFAPVPVGVPGELFVGGPGLARGYWARPGLTAERFLPDPFGSGTRVYRTGDRVRWLPDGTLEFLGRHDDQVKLRGFRIELGEVETRLRELPGVDGAVAMVRRAASGEDQLVGYVTGTEIAGPALREALAERLPGYLVPSAVVVVAAWPLTPNGKIDKRALPDPVHDGTGYRAPDGPVEEALAGVFAGVLGLPGVGADDDFFLSGGNSLTVTRLVARVQDALGVELPVRAVFRSPTVAGLAALIRDSAETGADPVIPAPRTELMPLSFAQQRLWFLDRLQDDLAVYNVPLALRLSGPLDVAALQEALRSVATRHEVLRTRFTTVDGEPWQTVLPDAEIPLPVRAAASPEAAEALLDEEVQRPFDLAGGPLVRALLIRLGATDHVLAVTAHHSVADGWSLAVLHRELAAFYNAGHAADLPALPVQYADFAVWQRARLTDEVLAPQLDHWRQALTGAVPLELPTDRPRPPVATNRGATLDVTLPADLADRLRRLGQGQSATLFMTLLAAFHVLLARHAGQRDVSVGTVVAGRGRPELDDLVGFFVNTLVMRADLSGDPTFREVLDRTRRTALDAYTNQDLPFERLVETLAGPRDPARSPLFQVMFALQNTPAHDPAFDGLTTRRLQPRTTASKFDLSLSLEETGEGLRGLVEYSSDLFDPATVRRLMAGYEHLLAAVAADPDAPVFRLPLRTEADRERVAGWNATATIDDGPRLLHELVAAQARATPSATAVSAETGSLTYGELDRRADRLAGVLAARGVTTGRLVAVCLPRDLHLPVAQLAVLKAGGGYVPLDPDLPQARLAYLVEDAEPVVVVTVRELAGRLPAGAPLLVLDDPLVEAERRDAPLVRVSRDDLAYVIYTSGSTGQPKGVAVPHRGIVNLVRWHRAAFEVSAADRGAMVAGLGFDAAAWELWPNLAAGACVHLPPEDVRTSPERMRDWLVDRRVSVVFLPTVLAEEVIRPDWPATTPLRALLTGGSALHHHPSPDLPFTLVNNYGPTEFSVVTTSGAVPPVESAVPPSMGAPISGTRVEVLDEGLQPVPIGVAGELFVGGEGLARGYWRRPGLTADRFVPDPSGSGGRLYRTGDRVKWRADGTLEFLGRLDDQIKLRGHRIEPGEIEAALLARPGVRQAVVTLVEDRFLAAYVAGEAPADELRAELAARLPGYMVPAAIITLPVLPLTPNGKVDLRALPDPGRDEHGHRPPADQVEELLAGVYATVLGRPGDDFFLSGGNSLAVTRLVARIHAAFGVQIPVRAVFQSPTVAALARHVRRALGGPDAEDPTPITPVADRERLPLSFAQHRLWFLDQLQGDLAVYNVPLILRLDGPLEVTALRQAVTAVAGRHEVLRSRFEHDGGRPWQVAVPGLEIELPVHDLTGSADRLHEVVDTETGRPFDLTRGPLVRALLIRLDDREHVLVVTAHHSVADGWSLGVLHRELSACYNAASRGQAPDLPALRIQYGDYAAWQHDRFTDETLAPHLGYWRDRLAGAAQLELPTDRPRPAVTSHRGAGLTVTMPGDLLEGLRRLGRAEGTTLFMTLLAAFQAVLARHSGQDDISVGTPVAGRGRPELDDLVGFFVNTIVLRGDLSGDPAFRELLARTRQAALDAYTHQDLPFERLVEAVGGARDPGRSPLFQVLFALQNTPAERPEFDGLATRPLPARTTASKFDLTVSMEETPDGLAAVVEYSTDLFDPATIERLMGHYRQVLEAVTADPDLPVSRLPLLTAAERDQLARWNATDRVYPGPELLHELVTAQARSTPAAVALSADDGTLTYAEMEERANRLANLLRTRGVGVGGLVGVCLDRGLDLPVTLLAALKAGGAYVPLDPGYPLQRLAYMIEDAAPAVTVTTRELAARLPAHSSLLVLDDPETATGLTEAAPDAPVTGVRPDDLAYLIYTSGSTGRPKGAMNSHAAIRNRLLWMQEEYGLDATDRVLQKTPMSFDVSVWEFFWPLMTGARMVLARPGGHKDPAYLRELIIEAEVTTLHFVPPMLHVFLDQEGVEDCRSLRRVVCSGQALPPDLADRFFARLDAGLHNLYGPTEAAVDVSYWACRPGDETVPIGAPIANIRLHVLDANLQEVPVGVPGELLIGGVGVARGYRDRPGLTGERFVPDPSGSGERLYRTGDRVRRRPDGTLEFLGRYDDQVKLRGFRIELGEIESTLLAFPGVRQATVTVAERDYLAAYVVGDVPAERDLRTFLAERLPDHMVPAAIITLPALPLTPNGKVDRRALPAPDVIRAADVPYAAPGDGVEARLAAIWRETLQVARVGADDNFFDLGGHSLLLPVVRQRIHAGLGHDVPMLEFFRRPTLRALAELLGGEPRETPVPAPAGEPRRRPSLGERRLRLRDQS